MTIFALKKLDQINKEATEFDLNATGPSKSD
jgi:hypothetical protein